MHVSTHIQIYCVKNSADRSLLVDLMYWVSQNSPPAHLFLISGDRDFASVLHRAASIMWPWHALLTGETLAGKYYNQPPYGPYGSWYGYYKAPYSIIEQQALSQAEKLSVPLVQILSLFSRFLLAIPHILKLKSLGDGNFLVHGISTEPVSDNGDWDLNLASQLDCEDRCINVSVNRKLSVATSHEPNVEEPCEKLEHPSNGSFTRDSDGNLQPSHNSFLPLMRIAQDSPSEVGYFKRIWRNGFGGRDNVSGTTSHNDHEEFCTSGDDTENKGPDSQVKQHTCVDNAVR
ncbi:unnamed protein product [Malus baccata var. baccata]